MINFDAKEEYEALTNEIESKVKSLGLSSVCDMCVDAENAGVNEKHLDYWPAMVASLKYSVFIRLEEKGVNLNTLLNRVIF